MPARLSSFAQVNYELDPICSRGLSDPELGSTSEASTLIVLVLCFGSLWLTNSAGLLGLLYNTTGFDCLFGPECNKSRLLLSRSNGMSWNFTAQMDLCESLEAVKLSRTQGES